MRHAVPDNDNEDFVVPSDEAAQEQRHYERQRKALIAVIVLLALLLIGAITVFGYLTRPLQSAEQPAEEEGWSFRSSITSWGGGPDEKLVRPEGVAFGPDGTLYVSDYNGRPRILGFRNGDSRPEFAFGEFGAQPGQIGGVWSLAIDADGNIYGADNRNSRVQVWDAQGNRVREIPARHPQAVHIEGDTLYVGEQGSVALFTLEGDLLRRFGEFGREEGQFDRISGIDVDDAGNIYVADGPLNRVQKLDKDGNVLWVQGTPPKSISDTERVFDFAADVRLAADGNLYVLEGLRSRVSVLDPETGEVLRTLSERGSEDGQLLQPKRFALAEDGLTLAISDTFNDRVQYIFIGEEGLLDRLTGPRRAGEWQGWLNPYSICGIPLLLLALVILVTYVADRVARAREEH